MTAATYVCSKRPVYLGSFADPRSAKVGEFQAALRNLTANRAVFAASTFALNISAAPAVIDRWIDRSIYLSIYLSIYPSIHPSIYPSI